MTERHDDLASAALDGELDDAERAAIAGDPVSGDAVGRAQRELAVVQAALAAAITVPEGLADVQIARAIELAGATSGWVDHGAEVVPLATRRATGGRRSWLVARAAGAVLVLGGLGVGVAAVLDDPPNRDDLALTAGSRAPVEQATDTAGGVGAMAESTGGAGGAGPASPEAAARADAAPGVDLADAAPGTLSRSASELMAGTPLDAPGLAAALVRIHGPAATWPAEPAPPDTCRPALDGAPQAPVAVVAVERAGDPLELVVPAHGQPYFVARGSCVRDR